MIRIARDVNKAVELINTRAMLELINDIVDVELADPDPTKISVIITNTFFSYLNFYISSYNIRYHI